jgi:hypothetical protein
MNRFRQRVVELIVFAPYLDWVLSGALPQQSRPEEGEEHPIEGGWLN